MGLTLSIKTHDTPLRAALRPLVFVPVFVTACFRACFRALALASLSGVCFTMLVTRLSVFALACASAICLFGQEIGLQQYLQRLNTAPGVTIEQKMSNLEGIGVTLSSQGISDLEAAVSQKQPSYSVPTGSPQLRSPDGTNRYLGNLNGNEFDPNTGAHTVRIR